MTDSRWLFVVFFTGLVGLMVMLAPAQAQAQIPMAVPTLQPAAVPVVAYMPERRGLFGLQTVYRPVVTWATPVVAAPAPVVVASPVIQAPVFQAPLIQAPGVAPMTMYRAPLPVTTFRVPAPVVVAPAPVTVFAPPVQVFSPVVPVFVP